MLYEEARTQIATGDLIAVRDAHSWLGRLTQLITRSTYTHTGVAIWVGDRLYMAELNGGRNHLVPPSQLKNFDVMACPAGLVNIEEAILVSLTHPIDYGFAAFVMIGLLNLLHLKLFVHWRRIIVCSGYCVAVYESAGWPERSRTISPQELVDQLDLKLLIRSA